MNASKVCLLLAVLCFVLALVGVHGPVSLELLGLALFAGAGLV